MTRRQTLKPLVLLPLLLLAAAPGANGHPPIPINPEKFVSRLDYPEEALNSKQAGLVLFELVIPADGGKPVACRILQSSGAASLDRITCAAMLNRGRFRPAVDEAGKPIASIFRRYVAWNLPGKADYAAPKNAPVDMTASVSRLPSGATTIDVIVRLVVGDENKLESCAIEEPSAVGALDRQACTIAGPLANIGQELDAAGTPQRTQRLARIRFRTR